jgi:hypothetical protein
MPQQQIGITAKFKVISHSGVQRVFSIRSYNGVRDALSWPVEHVGHIRLPTGAWLSSVSGSIVINTGDPEEFEMPDGSKLKSSAYLRWLRDSYDVTLSMSPERFNRIVDLAIAGAFPETKAYLNDGMRLGQPPGGSVYIWDTSEHGLIPLTGFDLIYDLQSYERTKTAVSDE